MCTPGSGEETKVEEPKAEDAKVEEPKADEKKEPAAVEAGE